jgi:dolichol-phosphate mannosyltransferase
MYDLTVIIPTLNEAETIEETITKVNEVLLSNNINGEILVVDDNSSMDTTIFILFALKRKFSNLNVIIRQRDHGLSQSLVEGFSKAKADIIQVIDADGQHPAEKISELYKSILDGNDIAIGSRYVKGGGIKNWSLFRRFISWGATVLARIFFPAITDSGSGFFAFRKEVIKDAPLKPQGFRMLFEILGKGNWEKVKEIPYILGVREKGKSKLTYRTVIAYLKQIWGLLYFSLTHTNTHGYAELKRLVTYMCVGAIGSIFSIIIMVILTELLGFWYGLSSLIGMELSLLSNFILNNRFTFNDVKDLEYSIIQRLISYHIVSIIGILINLIVLVFMTELIGIWYVWSSIIGILVAFMWNFTVNRGITWRAK